MRGVNQAPGLSQGDSAGPGVESVRAERPQPAPGFPIPLPRGGGGHIQVPPARASYGQSRLQAWEPDPCPSPGAAAPDGAPQAPMA